MKNRVELVVAARTFKVGEPWNLSVPWTSPLTATLVGTYTIRGGLPQMGTFLSGC